MKKVLLFASVSLLFFATAYAQSLSLSWVGGAISNGQTITIAGDTAGTVYSYIDCSNTSATTVTVKVKKKHVNIVSGTENSFCWVTCYLPNVFLSNYSKDIAADSTAHDFSGEYNAHGNVGITTVMYTFFNIDNEADSAWVLVNYDCSMSSTPEIQKPAEVEFSNAYPNPASTQVSFRYKLPDMSGSPRMMIRDILGNTVISMPIRDTEGTLNVETSSLSDGVYFYSLTLDGQPYFTKKLVIKN